MKYIISYKTERSTFRLSFQEDQMVLANDHLSKSPHGNPCFYCRHGHENSKWLSITFECSLCKVPLYKPSSTKDCWNSHLIAGLPKKRRQKKGKIIIKIIYILSKEKLKCRESAGLVMLQVFNKVRNELKQLKMI